MAAGDYELARRVVSWVLPHHVHSKQLHSLRMQIHVRLVGKFQQINPFKLVWYGGSAGCEIRPLGNTKYQTKR